MKLNETESMMGLDTSIDITHQASGFSLGAIRACY
jgi:hypothetical protein